MKRIFACYLAVSATAGWSLSASVARGGTLYDYAAGGDPSAQGWSISDAGELTTLVSIDGALVSGADRQPGWLLCDRATNAGAALTYGGSPWAQVADWSVTMSLRWEENAYDASGAVPSGGNGYFQAGNRQNFRWRVGNGATGYYEVTFGQKGGASIIAADGSLAQPGVAFASFGQDVSLTLAVIGGEASLFLGEQLVLEHLELTLSDDECNGMMLGDSTGAAQGCVTLHSVTFVPEPSVTIMVLAAAAAGFGRRRRTSPLA